MTTLKKWGLMLGLMMSILLGSQLFQANTAFAEDVWISGDDRCSYYLETDTIYYDQDYYASVKQVLNNRVSVYQYRFIFVEDYIVVNYYGGHQWRFLGRVGEDRWATTLWDSIQPYI